MKTITLTLGFLLSSFIYSHSQTKSSDSLSSSQKAIIEVLCYSANGELIDRGSGAVIDSAGNAITMFPLISEADIVKVKTFDGNIQEVTQFNGLDYEGGMVRFKLNHKPEYFVARNQELVMQESKIYIYDGNELKEGSVRIKNNLKHYGNTMKVSIPELKTGNNGNAILSKNGKLIGVIVQEKGDPENVVALDASRIDKIQSYEKEKFNEDYFRGVIAMSKEKYKKAYLHFNKSLEKNPYNTKALTRRGEIKIKYQDYLGAIDDFNNVLMIDLDDDYAFYSIGLAYFNLHNYNIANDWFSNAIKYNNDNKYAFKMRAESRFLLGSYAAAITDLDQALELDENYGDAYYIRGICKASGKKTKRAACTDLKRAKALGVKEANLSLDKFCK